MLSKNTKTILGLKLATDPRWVSLAEKSIGDILIDHAYCEQKAALSCISLIQKYWNYSELVDAVTPIVSEEWSHFDMVLNEIRKNGLEYGPPRKDEYVNKLIGFCQKGGSERVRLLDQLLLMALIEARSCERFKRLSEGLKDNYWQQFYRHFMESEAGHYTLFIKLAKKYIEPKFVENRWLAFLKYEAEVMQNLTFSGKTIH